MAKPAHSTPAPSVQPVAAQLHALLPLGCPRGVPAHEWRLQLETRLEAHLGAVDALLAALDRMDPDTYLEDDNCSEPSLGWPNDSQGRGAAALAPADGGADLEYDPSELEHDPSDDEPECEHAIW